jgi:hypothetical protein
MMPTQYYCYVYVKQFPEHSYGMCPCVQLQIKKHGKAGQIFRSVLRKETLPHSEMLQPRLANSKQYRYFII